MRFISDELAERYVFVAQAVKIIIKIVTAGFSNFPGCLFVCIFCTVLYSLYVNEILKRAYGNSEITGENVKIFFCIKKATVTSPSSVANLDSIVDLCNE